MLQPVILCGGNGTRLWPLSRVQFSKPFIEVAGNRVLFADTVARCAALRDVWDPIVVCNDDHRFLVAEQLRRQSVSGQLVLEPCGRDTAPATAVAALLALEDDPVLLVCPADHAIPDTAAFARAVALGHDRAMQGHMVCLGVTPDHPHTGYGYIRTGGVTGEGVHAVHQFVEKPDQATAQQFVDSGEYLWNCGVFLFRASRFLDELERYAPEILQACREAVSASYRDLDFIRLGEVAFRGCPSRSVDYAVMEQATDIEVIPFSSTWSDLGSWSSLHALQQQDEEGNGLHGDVVVANCRDSYVRSSGRLVVGLGLRDMTVVETGDAVLVASNDVLDDLKSVIGRLDAAGRTEARVHKVVYRPWGSFESVALGDRFQVKKIIVKPGEILSLQKHFHRAEHWVVVKGTARIVNGDKEFILREDESSYIPLGNVHRLENPGKIPLELIEVQTGSYLGEDDIVRLEDKYRRERE